MTSARFTIDAAAEIFAARMLSLGYEIAAGGAHESGSRYVTVRFVVGQSEVECIDGSMIAVEDTETIKVRFSDHEARYERDLDVAVLRFHDSAHVGVDAPGDLDTVVERARALIRRRVEDAR
jgi:hypothetical protein